MAPFSGRWHRREALSSIWPRFAVLLVVAAVLVLAGIGVGIYAGVHGFGPTTGVWTQFQGGGAPQFEENGVAAFDPRAGKQIRCFGSPVAGTPAVTVAFDSQTCTWTRLPASGPQPKSEAAALVYHPALGKIIRIGCLYEGDYFDTWAYDTLANTWTDLRPTMPPIPEGIRNFAPTAAAYDPRSGEVILVAHSGTKTRTWAYDSRANAWTELATDGAPAGRMQAAFVYDKSLGKLLLFGGWGHFERAEGGLFGDTWAFDSYTDTWTELRPAESPCARGAAAMAYDDTAEKTVLFGGYSDGLLGDTWSYDPVQNTWTRLRTAGSPGPRSGATLFYDANLPRLVMTGGSNGYPMTPMFSDCWVFYY